jgi:hypothetical protein
MTRTHTPVCVASFKPLKLSGAGFADEWMFKIIVRVRLFGGEMEDRIGEDK